ncbi:MULTISPECIES: hypothetical protein [unclassified Bradyrhizobium]|uniref:hypothetical protein n=1 Tax=unclassified Bradyrhizobium TaxID=2631580 RepID=UPI001FFBF58B|nr:MULTISPECIES: hypothetical protein [unclassified Bradyrhizobium]
MPRRPGRARPTGCDAGYAVADEIRSAVMALRIAHGATGAGDHVTLSVGVASHVPGESDGGPDRLLAAAGQALYPSALRGKTARPQSRHLRRTRLAEFAGLGRDPVPAPGRRKSA